MMRSIIPVGVGHYWKYLEPVFSLLEADGVARLVATCDLEDRSLGVPHLRRPTPDSSLSDLLAGQDATILLSHPNEFHTPDATDLIGAGFDVVIEKPYGVSMAELDTVQRLVDTGNVGLSEYYLFMKTVPLLTLAGIVRPESFFHAREGLLLPHGGGDSTAYSGMIRDLIGDPISAHVEVLEGNGEMGRVEHRGPHLVDRRLGGGMIQDLGVHALVSLVAMEGYLGKLGVAQDVRTAHCDEYLAHARALGIPDAQIGESYADFVFETDTGVSVKVGVAKYVYGDRNRRHVTVRGTTGMLVQDLDTCLLTYTPQGGSQVPLLQARKEPLPQYYGVVRAVLETLDGDAPYAGDPTMFALEAQRHAQAVVDIAHEKGIERTFPYRATPEQIFT